MIEKSKPTPPTLAVGRILRTGARTGSVMAASTCWMPADRGVVGGRGNQLNRAVAINTMT